MSDVDSHASDLAALKALLQQGLSLSKQGSYERRLPAAAALPKLREALNGLRKLVREEPTAEAWKSLALAEESLLHYPAAAEALQQAIALSQPPDRKDLKRLIQVKEYAAKWESIGLTPQTLADLGVYLENALTHEPCDHSHRHTRAWLESRSAKHVTKAINSLQSVGGCCDCEVLLNVV
jgi:tetratricopeptide (TPR) repeat protein